MDTDVPGSDGALRDDPASFLRPRRVAVLRALHLGDLLCATPALRSLRSGWPSASITLIGLPWASEFAKRFEAIFDDFLPISGVTGLPEQRPSRRSLHTFLEEVRHRRFDVVVQLHGNGSVTNGLVEQFESTHTTGFYPPDGRCPDSARWIPFPEVGRERNRLLALTGFLGMPGSGAQLGFPITDSDRDDLDALDVGLSAGAYVCIHPGGRQIDRRWPPKRFAAVAEALVDRGFTVVLTGSRDERQTTARVAAATHATVVDLAGRTSLGCLAALLCEARAVLANDTGVAHLAEAVGAPSVVLFHPSQLDRWAPLDLHEHRVVCPAESAAPEQVVAELDQLLTETVDVGDRGGTRARWSEH